MGRAKYMRHIIQNIAHMAGTDVTTVKEFLMKLATTVARDILRDWGFERPGMAWIPTLKFTLPAFWHVVERTIPREKIVAWVKEFKETGKIPEEAIETVKKLVISPEVIKSLEPGRLEEYKKGIAMVMAVLRASGKPIPPELRTLASELGVAVPA